MPGKCWLAMFNCAHLRLFASAGGQFCDLCHQTMCPRSLCENEKGTANASVPAPFPARSTNVDAGRPRPCGVHVTLTLNCREGPNNPPRSAHPTRPTKVGHGLCR